MMGFQFDLADANRAAQELSATEDQLQKALKGALGDTGKDGIKLIKKKVSAATKVPQKRLGVRVKMRRYQDDGTVILWVGADPIPLNSIGKVRETTRSVVAGRITRRGAFTAHIGGGGLRGFIRERSDHYDPEQYGDVAYGVGYTKSEYGSLRSRFPVRLAVVRIDREVESAIAETDTTLQQQFDKHFLRWVKYVTLVRGASA